VAIRQRHRRRRIQQLDSSTVFTALAGLILEPDDSIVAHASMDGRPGRISAERENHQYDHRGGSGSSHVSSIGVLDPAMERGRQSPPFVIEPADQRLASLAACASSSARWHWPWRSR
jgi:hypothetical protein